MTALYFFIDIINNGCGENVSKQTMVVFKLVSIENALLSIIIRVRNVRFAYEFIYKREKNEIVFILVQVTFHDTELKLFNFMQCCLLKNVFSLKCTRMIMFDFFFYVWG